MEIFRIKHLYRGLALRLAFSVLTLATILFPTLNSHAQSNGNSTGRVSLDFNEVELPVFVRFISELTGKNFVLDDNVKKAGGKISVFSPSKVTPEQAYSLFVSALEVSRLAVIPKGPVYQIVPMGELPPERGVFVYKLKHANATDLAAVLTNLVARSQTVAQTAPGVRPPMRPLTEFEAPVQVFADKATNSVIISSTKLAYSRLHSVIRDLDSRRKQVFVEAVILEVQVDRLRQIGSDPLQVIGVGKSGSVQGIAGFNTAPENLATVAQTISGIAAGSATGGATTVLNTVNVRAFLQLLLSLTDTNVLSTPQVLAADNQKAKIVVGENRPFPTGQAQGITGGTLVTIERKDVGVTLELTPQVLEDDLIRLEIKQEITAIAENVAQTIGTGTSSVPVGPTTTKRSMETTTVAKDHQTLVVGGLVRDNVILSERKIPLLGDIPWLGWLFKFQSRATEKLNLLVFLTPTLVRDEIDMVELNARKAAELSTLQRQNRIEEPTGVKQEVFEKLERPNSQPRPLPNQTEPPMPLPSN
ncbi:putative general secretion pathway protein D [Nitrospira sp. KM1]|uniref:secretin N-terminal domain-containing protein n=1 Tax=Nitrospira sp. KM1 TaxID=1936990 RepID=UPI0013A7910C|nr:secretin N-terminal domain-containing protein [Nitrospira sp. KM1]BCA55080.1 putative general secretion pathway protein D [Nitrospira sp. KM1]